MSKYTIQKKKKIQLSSWKKKRNPYRQKQSNLSYKKKIYLSIIVLSFLSMMYIIVFNTFFHVTKIKITGNERIKSEECEQTVLGIINYDKFFFLPGQSYVLIDTDEIRDILMEKYILDAISVRKEFPNELIIEMQEKISTVIFDDGKKYAYVDINGYFIEELETISDDEWNIEYSIVTSTDEHGNIIEKKEEIARKHIPRTSSLTKKYGNHPIVYYFGNIEDLKDGIVKDAIKIFHGIEQHSSYSFGYLEILADEPSMYVHTLDGPILKFSQKEYIEKQIVNFKLFLEKGSIAYKYIDLRFKNTVYWQ
jgi:hypothetical protein